MILTSFCSHNIYNASQGLCGNRLEYFWRKNHTVPGRLYEIFMYSRDFSSGLCRRGLVAVSSLVKLLVIADSAAEIGE